MKDRSLRANIVRQLQVTRDTFAGLQAAAEAATDNGAAYRCGAIVKECERQILAYGIALEAIEASVPVQSAPAPVAPMQVQVATAPVVPVAPAPVPAPTPAPAAPRFVQVATAPVVQAPAPDAQNAPARDAKVADGAKVAATTKIDSRPVAVPAMPADVAARVAVLPPKAAANFVATWKRQNPAPAAAAYPYDTTPDASGLEL